MLKSPLIAFIITLMLTGCSSFSFPGVYKMRVPQGNIVKQESLDKLRVGMTKRQVRYVLGTPMVTDSFNDQRWDYIFGVRVGDETFREERIAIIFEDDLMVRVDGELQFAQDKKPADGDALPQPKGKGKNKDADAE